jgi:hypothetical protein
MKKPYNPQYKPDQPVEYTLDQMIALQALERGDADARLQKIALSFIINDICRTYDSTYLRGKKGKRDSDFACGKRFVGLTMVKLIKLNPKIVKEENK